MQGQTCKVVWRRSEHMRGWQATNLAQLEELTLRGSMIEDYMSALFKAPDARLLLASFRTLRLERGTMGALFPSAMGWAKVLASSTSPVLELRAGMVVFSYCEESSSNHCSTDLPTGFRALWTHTSCMIALRSARRHPCAGHQHC